MANAACHPLTIDKGSDWEQTFIYLNPDGVTPIDLTGYTARMEIRPSVSSDIIIATLNTTNGKIIINPLKGEIITKLPNAETSAIAETKGVYDLELLDTGFLVTRLIQGNVDIRPEVTRNP